MEIETTRKLFSVDEYYRMLDAGILTEDDRVELIDGEILQMSPIGIRHAGCVNGANYLFTREFMGKAVVSIQNPLRLSDYTEPEPDVVLLKPRSDQYRGKHAQADDALLVLEVADTTLTYDRDVKLPRYAAAGVPEVWIEDLTADRLLVYRNPVGGRYQTELTLKPTDSVSVQALPGTSFAVDEFLG
jgi:Uma2 family endonuclease